MKGLITRSNFHRRVHCVHASVMYAYCNSLCLPISVMHCENGLTYRRSICNHYYPHHSSFLAPNIMWNSDSWLLNMGGVWKIFEFWLLLGYFSEVVNWWIMLCSDEMLADMWDSVLILSLCYCSLCSTIAVRFFRIVSVCCFLCGELLYSVRMCCSVFVFCLPIHQSASCNRLLWYYDVHCSSFILNWILC